MAVIKIARYRNIPYIVNPPRGEDWKPISWSGSTDGKIDIKEISEEVVQYLLMNSRCFIDGELVIINDNKEAKEFIDGIEDKEEYENNTHSREAVEKLLNGNFNKMKAELSKIENQEEKRFIVDIAKDINLDSASKRKWLADWLGINVEFLFDDDEETE